MRTKLLTRFPAYCLAFESGFTVSETDTATYKNDAGASHTEPTTGRNETKASNMLTLNWECYYYLEAFPKANL